MTLAPESMVTVADAVFEVSATLVAVTLTELGLSAFTGAVYSPRVDTVPTEVLPPLTPFTVHVTFVLLLPVTVAVNCCVCPRRTVAVVGLIVTATVCLPLPQPLCQIIVPTIAALNHRRRIAPPPTKLNFPLHMALSPPSPPRRTGDPLKCPAHRKSKGAASFAKLDGLLSAQQIVESWNDVLIVDIRRKRILKRIRKIKRPVRSDHRMRVEIGIESPIDAKGRLQNRQLHDKLNPRGCARREI